MYSSRLIVIFLITMLALMTQGCGKSKGKGKHIVDVHSNDGKIRNVIKQASLICENPRECPENVAQLVTISSVTKTYFGYDYRFQYCTAFLIDDDKLATNIHCIDSLFENFDGECKNKSVASFADGTKVFCEKILYPHSKAEFNRVYTDQQAVTIKGAKDLAILKIEKRIPGRNPLSPSVNLPVDGEHLIAYSVNPPPSGNGLRSPGKLKKRDCKTYDDTIFMPLFPKQSTINIPLFDCDLISGNSGSPILNSNGELTAVLFGGIDKSLKPTIIGFNKTVSDILDLKFLKDLFKTKIEDYSLNYAVNIQCVNDLLINYNDFWSSSTLCSLSGNSYALLDQNNESTSLSKKKSDIEKNISYKINNIFNNEIRNDNPYLTLSINDREIPYSTGFSFTPKCFAARKFIQEFNQLNDDNISFLTGSFDTLDYNLEFNLINQSHFTINSEEIYRKSQKYVINSEKLKRFFNDSYIDAIKDNLADSRFTKIKDCESNDEEIDFRSIKNLKIKINK